MIQKVINNLAKFHLVWRLSISRELWGSGEGHGAMGATSIPLSVFWGTNNLFQDHHSSTWAPSGCTHPISFFYANGCHLAFLTTSLGSQWKLSRTSEAAQRTAEDHCTTPLALEWEISFLHSQVLSSSSTVLITLGTIKYLIYPGTVFAFYPYNPIRLILLLHSFYRWEKWVSHRKIKLLVWGHTAI